jgi:hypothetical protein
MDDVEMPPIIASSIRSKLSTVSGFEKSKMDVNRALDRLLGLSISGRIDNEAFKFAKDDVWILPNRGRFCRVREVTATAFRMLNMAMP